MCTEVLMGGRPHQGYFQLLTIRIFIGFEILYRPQPELHFQKKRYEAQYFGHVMVFSPTD